MTETKALIIILVVIITIAIITICSAWIIAMIAFDVKKEEQNTEEGNTKPQEDS